MNKNLVSIIVPVFKNSHFLNDSLRSILDQTYSNIEIIIVDDGSPEKNKIKKIFRKFKKRNKIKLIRLNSNQGVSCALNKGIKNSKGEYISWLSHDDFLHKKKIDKQLSVLKKTSKKICFSNFVQVDKSKNKIKHITISSNLFEPKYSILFRDNFNICTALIKKSIFKKVGYFDATKLHTQDYNMMFKIFRYYKPIILEDFLFFSRKHKNQNSKIFINEAKIEKEDLYLSKFKEIKKIFIKSNIFKKIYIIFFLRNKNLTRINQRLIELINVQNIILNIILKVVILLNAIYSYFKSR